eukprot:SM000158S02021  [mRNA]  locus=s158:127585:128627:- [translate_table: standard]
MRLGPRFLYAPALMTIGMFGGRGVGFGFGAGCGFGVGWGFGGSPLSVLGLGIGGGCGVGLGLGWGFGMGYGAPYIDSQPRFQGIDFQSMKRFGERQEEIKAAAKGS